MPPQYLFGLSVQFQLQDPASTGFDAGISAHVQNLLAFQKYLY